MTYKEIEIVISTFDLKFYKDKIDYVENFNFEPNYFIYSFYDYIVLNNSIPTQNQFALFYLQNFDNDKFFKDRDKKELTKLLIYRLYRVYPSIIRDFHFVNYLRENLTNKIIYDKELDVLKGVDVLIDDKYAIHLYVDTNRSNYYRNKKDKRHTEDTYIHIDVPLNMNNAL